MLGWLKSWFAMPEPAGPPRTLRAFRAEDTPLTRDGVTREAEGWRLSSSGARTVALFEVAEPGVDRAILSYHARVRTADVVGGVYLEMWCRFPGRGEFFSKGFAQKVAGTTEWVSREVPFYLKASQRPDLVKLNLVFEGAGTVWVKDVELRGTPLR